MRVAAPLLLLFLACVARAASVPGGTALLPDGSRAMLDTGVLKEMASSRWPDWLALELVHPDHATDPEARSLMALDDGQRVSGNFEMNGARMGWRSRDLGLLEIDLERLQWIGPPSLAMESGPARDRVALVNGDRVEGFVNAMDPARGVQVEVPGGPDAGGTSRWMDLSRTEFIQLAARPRAATGWRLWLRDGSVVDVDQWTRTGDRVMLQQPHLPGVAATTSVAWTSIRAIESPTRGITPIWSRIWTASDLEPPERLAPPRILKSAGGALDLHAVDLHGPGIFTMQVPGGSWMLCATVDAPPQLAGQLRCALHVLDGDREVLVHRIDATTGSTPIRIPLTSGKAVFRISESSRGAFGAAVRLRDGLLVSAVAPSVPPANAPAEAPRPHAPDPR